MTQEEAIRACAAHDGEWLTTAEVAEYYGFEYGDASAASMALLRAWKKRLVRRRSTQSEWGNPCFEYAISAKGRAWLAWLDEEDEEWT